MRKSALAGRVAASVGVAMLISQGAASAQSGPIGLTEPVQATKTNLDPGRLYSSPTFAVDPSNSLRVMAGVADLRTRRCSALRSTDGGQNWSLLEASPAVPSFPFCAQTQGGVVQTPMAFGRNGTVYMAMGGWDDQDGPRLAGGIVLARSTDFGDSWQSVLAYNARGKTDPTENPRPISDLAVDRFSGSDDTVYITFNVVRPSPASPNAEPTSAMVAVSHDGGRTFDEPVDLASGVFTDQAVRSQAFSAVTTTTLAPNATAPSTTVPAAGSKAATPDQAANFGGSSNRSSMQAGVDGTGKAYVIWHSGTVNVTPAPPTARYLSTSTDGGRTWTTTQAIPFGYDIQARPRMAVSKAGVIHIVYGENSQPDIAGLGDVYHIASADGGKTWSEPVQVTDDDPGDFRGQYFPNMSVAPNGRVDVAWWDTRSDPGLRSNDVYYSYSDDNGKTWSANQRVTSQSVDRRIGVWGANYDINSVPAVASSNALAVFGWDDTRNAVDAFDESITSEFGAGLQDMYTAVAQFSEVGPANNDTARIVLAAVVGMLFVGLVLLGTAVAAKRRNGPVTPKVTKPSAAKVG